MVRGALCGTSGSSTSPRYWASRSSCVVRTGPVQGKVERGVGYVEGNFWPGARFVDLADLNRQAMQWIATVADVRIHGTTHERAVDRCETERAKLMLLPDQSRLASFLRDERTVGRDGYVRHGIAWYGVPWQWAGCRVQVARMATWCRSSQGRSGLPCIRVPSAEGND